MFLKQLLNQSIARLRGPKDVSRSEEQGPAFYDAAYASIDEYKLAYPDSRYYFVWTVIVDRIRRSGVRRILEIGCGPGQLARFLIDEGIESYVGLDFSETALALARQNSPTGTFVLGDARDAATYRKYMCDLILCTEVLEHVEADLQVVSNFPPGVRCLCSVPSFPYTSHVRHFQDSQEVVDRYQPFFVAGLDVFKLKMPGHKDDYYFLLDGVRNGHKVLQ